MLNRKIDPARLGFDFDGVIADTAETFLRLACEEFQHCDIRLEDITNFEVEKCLNIHPDIVETIFTRVLVDSVGTGLQPMPDAVEVLGELTEQALIHIVTARPLAEPVHRWLEAHLPLSTLPRIKIVAMGAHDDKSRHILAHGLSYFVDDRPGTCLQLKEDGITPIVFSQPWNRGCRHLATVVSWQEIRNLCL